jgi:hypothetical protein
VAHVNNPLSAARSSATFVRSSLRPTEVEVAAACEDMVSSLDRITSPVRRLRQEG